MLCGLGRAGGGWGGRGLDVELGRGGCGVGIWGWGLIQAGEKLVLLRANVSASREGGATGGPIRGT